MVSQPSLYSEELFDALKAAGCHTIIIGIDTYNVHLLKKYKRFVTRDKVEQLTSYADKLDINVCADFIFGLENETEVDLLKTIDYSLRLPLDFASFNIATPLPGSSIREKAIEDGRLKLGDESFDTLGDKEVLGNGLVSSKRLLQIKNIAVLKFYLRPSYLWRRLRRTDSWEYFMNQLEQMFSMFAHLIPSIKIGRSKTTKQVSGFSDKSSMSAVTGK